MTGQTGSTDLLKDALNAFRTGQLDHAAKACRAVLLKDKGNREARHLMALITFRTGAIENAARQLRALVSENPNHPSALNDLGMVLTRLGSYQEAEAALVSAITLAPKMAVYQLNLANLYKQTNVLGEAERAARAAIRIDKTYADGFRALSEILGLAGQADEGVKAARRAVALSPKDPRSQLRLAEALNGADDVAAAREAYKTAMALSSGNPQVGLAYGQFLFERGYLEETAELMRSLLSAYPNLAMAHMLLSRAIRFESFNDEMARMEELVALKQIDEASRISLHFGLAKAYEDIKAFDKAFAHARDGNTLARKAKTYAAADTSAEFDTYRSAFTPAVISRHGDAGHDDGRPIFVLGMPRSGTSLVEQVLAAHPDVHGAGEVKLLYAAIRDAQHKLGVADAVGLVEKASPGDWKALGEAYIGALRQFAPKARRIVNKMPDNFRFIGHIRMALPKAKVIYCRRSAPDNCVSIFNLNFGPGGPAYSNDLGELGDYYCQHESLMRHWQETLPGFVHEIRYEDMVADQEGESRRLLAFCGLDWDESVLDFFRSDRRVRTATAAQVRQPIYKSSVGRYRNYGDAIRPLLDALGWDEEKDAGQR